MLSQFEIWDWENEIFGHVWFFLGNSYVSIVCEIASPMCAKPKDGGGNVFIMMILYPDASALVSHACKTRHLHSMLLYSKSTRFCSSTISSNTNTALTISGLERI